MKNNTKETASLKGGLTFRTSLDPYRKGDKQATKPNPEAPKPVTSGFSVFGTNLLGKPAAPPMKLATLAREFITPPFSVLNTRDGAWLQRKRAWIKLGIESEVGRDDNLTFERSITIGYKRVKQSRVAADGKEFRQDLKHDETVGPEVKGTSVFDPVLCELMYNWFCPPGGLVLDPFAGGCVRGVVAAKIGRKYHGIELREEQVEANRNQWKSIAARDGDNPKDVKWVCGDSLVETESAPECDFIFSCPPYADLEVYSDDPRDLSNMPYEDFVRAYKRIIRRSCERLKENRFACFVVGDVRDKAGIYRNFVGDTVRAFIGAGLGYYNEAIILNWVGSLRLRAGKQFRASRKLGKMHQNLLVFIKGDAKKATKAICGTDADGE